MAQFNWEVDTDDMKNVVIFAPHIDDEVIGCWSVLSADRVSDVYYFYDITPDRQLEAEACAKLYNFAPHFVEAGDIIKLPEQCILFLPNIADNHINHKQVNIFGRSFAAEKKFYSVDMNVPFRVLTEIDSTLKRRDLAILFPSQLVLKDEKYHLFEAVSDTDLIKQIKVKTNFVGYHKYPSAPDEVAFLRNEHRHVFHVVATLDVHHSDRELEYFMVRNVIDKFIGNDGQMNHKSCEMIAEDILEFLIQTYPKRSIEVDVSEDNENGSVVKYNWR